MTFSGVASNFAGVPLAFAFMATLGRLGLVTVLLRNLGFDLYARGFNILTFWGLTVTYLYFQIPLMVLVVAPAIDGLKREWAEAARDSGREFVAILANDRPADPDAQRARRGAASVRQRFRGDRDGLCAHRFVVQHRADPALRSDPRRRAARPQPRLRDGGRHAGDHRTLQPRLSRLARARAAGPDEPRPSRRMGRNGAGRNLFPRSPGCDLRVLAAHAPRAVQFRRLPGRVRERQVPGVVPLFDRAGARHDRRGRGAGRADRLFRPPQTPRASPESSSSSPFCRSSSRRSCWCSATSGSTARPPSCR